MTLEQFADYIEDLYNKDKKEQVIRVAMLYHSDLDTHTVRVLEKDDEPLKDESELLFKVTPQILH